MLNTIVYHVDKTSFCLCINNKYNVKEYVIILMQHIWKYLFF